MTAAHRYRLLAGTATGDTLRWDGFGDSARLSEGLGGRGDPTLGSYVRTDDRTTTRSTETVLGLSLT
ncbi:hypothetical protein [Halopiger thermotolerans]